MSDFDPTKNCTPFGLLSKDEQSALFDWTHGWEFYHWEGKWDTIGDPSWSATAVYRGKPAPVVTSAWWNVYPSGSVLTAFPTRKMADDNAGKNRIAVLRIDTCSGVSTAHLEDV